MIVQTVLGAIDVDDLGVTLTHEHLALDEYRVLKHHVDFVLADTELACHELALYKSAGGGTLFEVTTPDLGRRPDVLVEVSKATGVHVLMGAGRYLEPFYEPEIWRRSVRDIALELISEIEVGVDGIRAALLGEIGVSLYHVSPAEERVHRAVARAHNETGAPITTHSTLSPVGLEQLDIFAEEGVDLSRVAIGHCETFPHRDYHEAILRRGSFVQFDLIHGSSDWETRRQVQLVRELIDAGYREQILLSQDVCAKSHLTAYGGNGYGYLLTSFIPMLLDAGVSKEEVDMLLMRNPRRLLTGEAPERPPRLLS